MGKHVPFSTASDWSNVCLLILGLCLLLVLGNMPNICSLDPKKNYFLCFLFLLRLLCYRSGQLILGWIQTFLINFPFLVIRIYVKLEYDNTEKDYAPISLLVVKNVLFILIGIRGIIFLSKATKVSSFQMEPSDKQQYLEEMKQN